MKRLLPTVSACALLLAACGAGAPSASRTTTAAHEPGKLPAGVQTIDVHGGHVSRHVTDRAKVARIVHWFDALHAVKPRPHAACPLVLVGPTVTFDFRSRSGALLARARAPSGVSNHCNPIVFSSGGRHQTPLVGGDFVARVERLLGVRFGGAPAAP